MTTTPELDDRRIEAMRSSIMSTVDDDVARRGRKMRRGLGVVAAACVVVVVGGVGVSALTGGSGSADQAGTSQAAEPGVAGDSGGIRQDAALGQDEADDAPAKVAPRDVREVVTTGSVDVTVSDPRATAEQFTTWIEKRAGRVDGRTESKDDEGRTSASLTVRVPSQQMSAALAQLATYGDVGTVDVQNDDVTAQGQDLDARIKALELSIDRLEKILAKADSSAEVVSAEGALTQRQEQLESLQAQRKGLTEQVHLSTLYVELIQKGSASTVSPSGFKGGLAKGWDALVDTVNAIVSLAGILVPWLGLALLAWVLWRLGRRVVASRLQM